METSASFEARSAPSPYPTDPLGPEFCAATARDVSIRTPSENYFLPSLERANLRRFRFHDLRHYAEFRNMPNDRAMAAAEIFRTSAIRHSLALAEGRNTEQIHEGIRQGHASPNILERPGNQPCRGSWLGRRRR